MRNADRGSFSDCASIELPDEIRGAENIMPSGGATNLSFGFSIENLLICVEQWLTM